jgi:hypothetical protein
LCFAKVISFDELYRAALDLALMTANGTIEPGAVEAGAEEVPAPDRGADALEAVLAPPAIAEEVRPIAGSDAAVAKRRTPVRSAVRGVAEARTAAPSVSAAVSSASPAMLDRDAEAKQEIFEGLGLPAELQPALGKLTVMELQTLATVLQHSVEEHVNKAGVAGYQQGIAEGHARGVAEGIQAEIERVKGLEPAFAAILKITETADAWEANRLMMDDKGVAMNLDAARAFQEAHVEAIFAYRQATTIKK